LHCGHVWSEMKRRAETYVIRRGKCGMRKALPSAVPPMWTALACTAPRARLACTYDDSREFRGTVLRPGRRGARHGDHAPGAAGARLVRAGGVRRLRHLHAAGAA